MLALKLFAAAALLARGALSDGVHLFNCGPFGGEGVPQTWLSLVVVG